MILRVCDLGGTHCRIGQYVAGRLDAASGRAFPQRGPCLLCGLDDALPCKSRRGARRKNGHRACCTFHRGDVVALTNLDWIIDRHEISRASGVPQVFLINDFEALGHALSSPQALQSRSLQEAPQPGNGPRLILGAGTGFNCAVRLANGSVVFCEAGHSSFVAETDLDRALQARISQKHGRCSNDRVLSGSGLAEIYRTLCDLAGRTPRHATSQQIVPAALGQDDDLAVRTCREFARMLGRAAGDLALVFLATGGVYVTGGMAHALQGFMTGSEKQLHSGIQGEGAHGGQHGSVAG